jgi:hypothetical protein
MHGPFKCRHSLALVAVLVLAAAVIVPLASASARTSKAVKKPVIQTEEVGYFGNALTTNQVSVFAYSNLSPKQGNHVTICVNGVCEKAQGHNAHLAWYTASFATPTLHMWDPVAFTVTMSDSAGHSKVTVTKGLLCLHNNGSTPQTS